MNERRSFFFARDSDVHDRIYFDPVAAPCCPSIIDRDNESSVKECGSSVWFTLLLYSLAEHATRVRVPCLVFTELSNHSQAM